MTSVSMNIGDDVMVGANSQWAKIEVWKIFTIVLMLKILNKHMHLLCSHTHYTSKIFLVDVLFLWIFIKLIYLEQTWAEHMMETCKFINWLHSLCMQLLKMPQFEVLSSKYFLFQCPKYKVKTPGKTVLHLRLSQDSSDIMT